MLITDMAIAQNSIQPSKEEIFARKLCEKTFIGTFFPAVQIVSGGRVRQ